MDSFGKEAIFQRTRWFVNFANQVVYVLEDWRLQDTALSIVHPTLLKLPAYLILQLVLLEPAFAVIMEMEESPLCIGHNHQMPSMPTEELVEAIEPRKRFMYARSVAPQIFVLEALKVGPQVAPGKRNQALTKQYAFQFRRVLSDKNQHMVCVLLVPQGLTFARAERSQNPRAALARYPMQVQRLVFMTEQLSALLEHSSIHLLHQMIRIVLLAPLVTHVRVAPLLHRSVVLAKS